MPSVKQKTREFEKQTNLNRGKDIERERNVIKDKGKEEI